MKILPTDREQVYRSLPADRRTIVRNTGIPSYQIPAVLRWLKRRRLAANLSRGIWTPTRVPTGVNICWKHGTLTVDGCCPTCSLNDEDERDLKID